MLGINNILIVLSLFAVVPARGQLARYYPKGSITTKDGVTRTGAIYPPGKQNYYYVHAWNDPRTYAIRIGKIRKMRLSNDGGDAYFDVIAVRWWPHCFWRLRAGTDSAGVIDNEFNDGNGSRLYIFHGRYRKKIYGKWDYYQHHQQIELLLLHFINRYYPTDKVLTDSTAMINYLAGRAVELKR